MYNINLLLVHLTIEQVMMVLNSAGIRDRPFFFYERDRPYCYINTCLFNIYKMDDFIVLSHQYIQNG